MSTTSNLSALGVRLTLAPGGAIQATGLKALPSEAAEQARDLIRQHRDELVAALQAEAALIERERQAHERLRQADPDHWSCWLCGSTRWWRTLGGSVVCADCHPPTNPERFLAQGPLPGGSRKHPTPAQGPPGPEIVGFLGQTTSLVTGNRD